MTRRNTMALRERTWMILIRPYYGSGGKTNYYTGTPKAGLVSDLGASTGQDLATALKGNEAGMEAWNQLDIDKGGWTAWYVTTSYDRLLEKYKECLVSHAKEFTRVVEVIPTDFIITPFA